MTYTESIRAVNAAQTHYFLLCERAETDDAIFEALELLHRRKAEHREQFLTLTRHDGEWI